jgi:predicted amidohydrolase
MASSIDAGGRGATRAVRVTVVELPARWGAPAAALAEVDALLARGPATDLVLLPEASLTGYVSPRGDFDLTSAGEPLDGPTAAALAALAARHGVHLVGPLIEADGAARYNATVGFAPDGARVLHYRKRHPWVPERWATPGDRPYPRLRIGALEVTVATCYDVHFLVAEAADVLATADLLLFPSAWVDREDTRAGLLTDLAARFGIAIANANWAPGVVRLPGQGGSCIIAGGGRLLTVAAAGVGRADALVQPRSSHRDPPPP